MDLNAAVDVYLPLSEGKHYPTILELLTHLDSYRMMGINMDEIGMAWIIDNENGFIWHNGGTGHYKQLSRVLSGNPL